MQVKNVPISMTSDVMGRIKKTQKRVKDAVSRKFRSRSFESLNRLH